MEGIIPFYRHFFSTIHKLEDIRRKYSKKPFDKSQFIEMTNPPDTFGRINRNNVESHSLHEGRLFTSTLRPNSPFFHSMSIEHIYGSFKASFNKEGRYGSFLEIENKNLENLLRETKVDGKKLAIGVELNNQKKRTYTINNADTDELVSVRVFPDGRGEHILFNKNGPLLSKVIEILHGLKKEKQAEKETATPGKQFNPEDILNAIARFKAIGRKGR